MVSKSSMVRVLWEILVVCPSPLWISLQLSWIVTGLSSCWTTPPCAEAQATGFYKQLPFTQHHWVLFSKAKIRTYKRLFGMCSTGELLHCINIILFGTLFLVFSKWLLNIKFILLELQECRTGIRQKKKQNRDKNFHCSPLDIAHSVVLCHRI